MRPCGPVRGRSYSHRALKTKPEKKTITIQVCGSEGPCHGHGGWELDPETWEVSENQFKAVKTMVESGEKKLSNMRIRGFGKKCDNILDIQNDFARQRAEGSGLNWDDCSVDIWIEVVALNGVSIQ